MISAKRFLTDCLSRIVLLAATACLFPAGACAQSALDELPDAPQASTQQSSPAPGSAPAQQNSPQAPQNSTPTPGTGSAPAQTQNSSAQTSGSSSSSQTTPNAAPGNAQTGQNTTETKEQQHERAQQELQQQEKQRIMGVMATFNTTSNANAAPLSPGQKYQLFFRGAIDPWQFFITAADAGLSQANDTFPGYGQGLKGYGKRWAAAYVDDFDGNFFGNAVLPSLLHEDPRYFRRGHGKIVTRALYAAVTSFWCKRDKGTWGPNYGNVGGNIIGGAISNLYYPQSDRGVGLTFERALTVTAEGAFGAELIEFWPDIERRFMKKHMDTLGSQAAQQGGSTSTTPAPAPASNAGAPAKPNAQKPQ